MPATRLPALDTHVFLAFPLRRWTLQAILLVVRSCCLVILHEYAHGYAALKQGDQTALMLGRLTLNPVKHIDLYLTIILPIVLYLSMGMFLGGAKPVPVNPRNYRNFKRGDIIVCLAGACSRTLLSGHHLHGRSSYPSDWSPEW